MHGIDTLAGLLPYLIPFAVLYIALLAFTLTDLVRRRYVTGGNKVIWILVILLIQAIGPITYLVAGRKEDDVESDSH